jgi:3-oxoacyl-[acyl-carrier protein] reductase
VISLFHQTKDFVKNSLSQDIVYSWCCSCNEKLRDLYKKNMESLRGKVALVTGAGKGIGKAVAIALAAEGANVGLVARTEKDLQSVTQELKRLGVKAAYARADVSNRAEVEAAVEKLQNELGPVDILINNAGTATFGGFLELEPEVWENQIKVNVFGVYYTTRAVLPQMIKRKTGDIVNISSTAGK